MKMWCVCVRARACVNTVTQEVTGVSILSKLSNGKKLSQGEWKFACVGKQLGEWWLKFSLHCFHMISVKVKNNVSEKWLGKFGCEIQEQSLVIWLAMETEVCTCEENGRGRHRSLYRPVTVAYSLTWVTVTGRQKNLRQYRRISCNSVTVTKYWLFYNW